MPFTLLPAPPDSKSYLHLCRLEHPLFFLLCEWYLPLTLFLISNVAYIIATKMDIAQMIFFLNDESGLTK